MKYFKIKNKPQLSPPLLSASAGPTTKAAQPRRPILATLVVRCCAHCTILATLVVHIVHIVR